MFFHLVAALATFAVPATPARDGDHHHNGNGRHNRNIISVRSPTHNHGYQHTNTSNAGGTNPVQNALCRHVTACTITQKVTIVAPKRPTPVEPQPVEPQPVEPRPVQPPPETLVPQSLSGPARRSPELPVRGPFLYIGPYGLMLMGPDSAMPRDVFGSAFRAFPAGLFG